MAFVGGMEKSRSVSLSDPESADDFNKSSLNLQKISEPVLVWLPGTQVEEKEDTLAEATYTGGTVCRTELSLS